MTALSITNGAIRSDFLITPHIPIPPGSYHTGYPLGELQVGSSFAIRAAEAHLCRAQFEKHRPMRFTSDVRMEKDIEVMRAWRIE